MTEAEYVAISKRLLEFAGYKCKPYISIVSSDGNGWCIHDGRGNYITQAFATEAEAWDNGPNLFYPVEEYAIICEDIRTKILELDYDIYESKGHCEIAIPAPYTDIGKADATTNREAFLLAAYDALLWIDKNQ